MCFKAVKRQIYVFKGGLFKAFLDAYFGVLIFFC